MMAEPRDDLGCRRPLQDMKWGHDLCIYPLLGKGFAGILWTKVAVFYTVLIFFTYLGSCASIGPYETMLATGGSLNGTQSRRSVDKILQDYAFRSFRHPKTGIIYDATVPTNLSGIKLNAVRLRSGSLRRRGIVYNEFDVPKGIVVSPYVERLVLVYQNFMNFSSIYYDTPGYKLVAPILGLLAYDASNLNATNLQELDIVARLNPILIRFGNMSSTRRLNSNPLCIFFSLNGTVSLSNESSPNVCSTKHQGHFSLVVQSLSPAPAPSLPPSQGPPSGAVSPPTTIPPSPTPKPASRPPSGNTSNSWKIAVGSSIGGVAAFVIAGVLCLGLLKYRKKSHIEHMEHQAEEAEALQTSMVGGSRAPIAGGTRTQPMLETEYVA